MNLSLTKLLKKTEKQASQWRYAAWTLPFVALALLIASEILGIQSVTNLLIIGIVVTFFAVSVFWWWWAIDKIYQIIKAFDKTDSSFEKAIKELKAIRKDIKDSNLL